MALRTARFRPCGRPDRRRAGPSGSLLLISLVIALAGCSPIEAWRSLNGVSRNDPDPQTAPFSHNLAAAEAAPYPNLASVPPLPTRATSTAERQKLTQSLIADRGATAADAGPAPPRAAAAVKPSPGAPAENLALTAPQSKVSSPDAALSGPARSPATIPAPEKTASNSAQSGRRKAGEPPEPGPPDSNLQMPELPTLPEPEAMRPPPPPPAVAAVSPPAATAEPPAAALASAVPQPAPPVPEMAPVAPPPPAAGKAEVKRPPAGKPALTTVATLEGPGAAAAPSRQEQAEIDRVAALYKDKPGTVRVLAYAAAPGGSGDPLDSYHAALDRAQAVAKALATAGIPAAKIQTEAVPAAGAKAGRVEIQLAR